MKESCYPLEPCSDKLLEIHRFKKFDEIDNLTRLVQRAKRQNISPSQAQKLK